MGDIPVPHERRRDYWSAPRERALITIALLFVLTLVIVCITVLRIRNDLDNASTTALFGAILGYIGNVLSTKLSTRSSDDSRG